MSVTGWPVHARKRTATRESGRERRWETPWRRVILFVKILQGDEDGRNRFNSGLTVSKDSLLFVPSPPGQSTPRVPGEKIQEPLLQSRQRERYNFLSLWLSSFFVSRRFLDWKSSSLSLSFSLVLIPLSYPFISSRYSHLPFEEMDRDNAGWPSLVSQSRPPIRESVNNLGRDELLGELVSPFAEKLCHWELGKDFILEHFSLKVFSCVGRGFQCLIKSLRKYLFKKSEIHGIYWNLSSILYNHTVFKWKNCLVERWKRFYSWIPVFENFVVLAEDECLIKSIKQVFS